MDIVNYCQNCESKNIINSGDDYNYCDDCGCVNNNNKYLFYITNYKPKFINTKKIYLKKKFKKYYASDVLHNENSDYYINEDLFNKLYEKIDDIIKINKLNNKYNINYDFIIYKIFELLKLDTKKIKITNNMNLYNKYNQIWEIVVLHVK